MMLLFEKDEQKNVIMIIHIDVVFLNHEIDEIVHFEIPWLYDDEHEHDMI